MQVPEPTFSLNAGTLAAVGGLLGTMAGVIGVLFARLIASKDAQIEAKDRELEQVRRDRDTLVAAKDRDIERITKERDYYLDRLFLAIDQAKQLGNVAGNAVEAASRSLRRGP